MNLDDFRAEVQRIKAENPTVGYGKIADILHCPKSKVQRAVEYNRKHNKDTPNDNTTETSCESDFRDNSGTVTTKSLNIKTVDEALTYAQVDLNVWEVDHFIINSWEVTVGPKVSYGSIITNAEIYTNWQVKIWLKRKVEKPFEIAMKNLIKTIPTFRYKEAPKFIAPSGIALEMSIVDVHVGKLAWSLETGRKDYDTDIATRELEAVVDQNLAWASPFKPEKIFYLLGNDLMHIENYIPLTPAGHNVLDTDTRFPKLMQDVLEVTIKTIYSCRSVAPVEVLWIPGNHDPHASYGLCLAIKEHFKDDDYVIIDDSPMKRKARLWGNLLVGWTHEISGRQASWVNELAQAFPVEWGKSVWREWHHGHKHKKNEVKMFPVLTHGGVLCRQLTALSPIDAWHFEHLFTDAMPGGESFLWSKNNGVIANFTAWTDPGIACNS